MIEGDTKAGRCIGMTAHTHPRVLFKTICNKNNQVASTYANQVKVYFSSTCDSIEQLPGSSGVEVKATLAEGEGGKAITFRPRLVVGADGLKSMVCVLYFHALSVVSYLAAVGYKLYGLFRFCFLVCPSVSVLVVQTVCRSPQWQLSIQCSSSIPLFVLFDGKRLYYLVGLP